MRTAELAVEEEEEHQITLVILLKNRPKSLIRIVAEIESFSWPKTGYFWALIKVHG